MTELRLRRDDADKKRYVLDGVGELQRGKWYERAATATDIGGRSWELKPSAWKRSAVALDAVGEQAAGYEPEGTFKRGGRLEVTGGDVRPQALVGVAEPLRALVGGGGAGLGGDEGLVGPGGGGGLAEGAEVEPLVLLMACWLVRLFGEDDAAAASGGAAAGSSERVGERPVHVVVDAIQRSGQGS